MTSIGNTLSPLARLVLSAAAFAAVAVAVPVATAAAQDADAEAPSAREGAPHRGRARCRGDRAGRTNRRVARMARFLGLTESQNAEVRQIVQSARAERRALRDSTEQGESRREAMRALRDETKTRIRGVLTAEQAERLEQRRARRAAHRARGDRGRRHRGMRGRSANGEGGMRGRPGRGHGRGAAG